MQESLSYEAEEYVEVIYRLQKRNGVAKTNELASKLGVVPGSITNTIKHLESHDLVKHQPYRGVTLTAKGDRIALELLRRHRLAERLLTDILHAKWSNVHEEACKLEHSLTRNVTKLLEERLGHPMNCPHGNSIPTEDGKLDEDKGRPLTELDEGQECIITCVADETQLILQQLASKEIKPGTQFRIIRRCPSQIVLSRSGKELILKQDLAEKISAKEVGDVVHEI